MKIVRGLIWSGFVALLAVSVPKIAWVFRSYEDPTPLMIAGIDARWLVPFFVAICIDALILALTYAVSVDRARASQFGMWSFVGLLCGLSYYCNYLYNAAYASTGSIWSHPFVGTVTPFIISGVPLFALCYTLILKRIDGAGETFEEKATRLESERAAKERIATIKRERSVKGVTALFDAGMSVVRHVKSRVKNEETEQENARKEERNTDTILALTVEESGEESARQSPDIAEESDHFSSRKPVGNQEETTEENAQESDHFPQRKPAGNGEETAEEFPEENLPSWLSTGGSTIALQTVTENTNISRRVLHNRVEKKEIRATKNKEIVYKASLIEWMKKEGYLQETGKIVLLHLTRNEEEIEA
jgi:hypothetical protein